MTTRRRRILFVAGILLASVVSCAAVLAADYVAQVLITDAA